MNLAAPTSCLKARQMGRAGAQALSQQQGFDGRITSRIERLGEIAGEILFESGRPWSLGALTDVMYEEIEKAASQLAPMKALEA